MLRIAIEFYKTVPVGSSAIVEMNELDLKAFNSTIAGYWLATKFSDDDIVTDDRQSSDSFKDLFRSPEHSVPSKRPAISKEGPVMRAALFVFDLDPVIEEVSPLLTVGQVQNAVDYNSSLTALEL
jgi:hypothetical protein